MSTGLKGQLGLGEPAPTTASDQAEKFKAEFQAAIDPINADLQYTAAHAPQAKHDGMAAKRDTAFKAYQAALAKVNPTDPKVAQGAIDQVLTAVKALGPAISTFKQDTEKWFTEWERRQPDVDTNADKVREMNEWGHPKAAPLQAIVDAIKSKGNAREYEEALKALDQLLAKAQPIIDDYEKQRAAQAGYEPLLATVQPRVDALATCDFKALAQPKQQLTATIQQAQSAASAKNYVEGLAQLKTAEQQVTGIEAQKAEIEAKKQQYEQALEALKPKLADASQTKYKKLEPMQQDFVAVQEQMESAATEEDFDKALGHCTDLSAKVDAYNAALQELEAKKQQYEQALEALKPKLDEAGQKAYQKLDADRKAYEALKVDMEAAATAEDYDAALQKCTDLTGRVDAYLNAVKELEAKKQQYEQAAEALKPKLEEAGQKTYLKLDADKKAYEALKVEMEAAATAEDYDAAIQKCTDLTGRVDAYLNAVKELEAKKQQYEQAVQALKPKLEEAGQKTYQKLASQKQEYETAKGAMESAAAAEDYDAALQKCTDLTGRVDAYLNAVKELEAKKQQYEQALEALKPKLAEAEQKPSFPELSQQKQEYQNLNGQMEAAAHSEEYDQAVKMANDLAAKLDAYLQAARELEKKQQERKVDVAQAFDEGYNAGLHGQMGMCFDNASPEYQQAYDSGYALGKAKAAKVPDGPGIRKARPGEELEGRRIAVLHPTGQGYEFKYVTGSKDELDRMEEEEAEKIRGAVLKGLMSGAKGMREPTQPKTWGSDKGTDKSW